MNDNATPTPVLREHYSAPKYLFDNVALEFNLEESHTTVTGEFSVRRAPGADDQHPLVLDGVDLQLISVAVEGRTLDADEYVTDDESLTIKQVPASFQLRIETRIDPQHNTALEGLYQSSGNYCTQCEPQGFRKIIYYPDRPDVLAVFDVKIVADKQRYPVMLSNGNMTGQGDLPGGRHWASWRDPFPKPCYLFALVAGDLRFIEDTFTTASGKDVVLRIYVEPHNIDKCDYAMEALKDSMRWDERVYRLEYDLDVYMIVVVDDFNMGAMENKGLNVFNSKYVLVDRRTATDADYMDVQRVVAHEYFHNWTGNRVTCRDWFQLSLKEGLTVFRDQQFSADMNSPGITRIEDVHTLRDRQFPEDAGPMAHPIRPDSYIEINNFYTVTVYRKGAEVIRMMHTLLGEADFHKGIDLYFERFDGQAVTCDDFVDAMQDAGSVDLTQFRRWYSQSGTPALQVTGDYNEAEQRYTLHLAQSCDATPDQPTKEAFHIPLRVALLDTKGIPIPLIAEAGDTSGDDEAVLNVTQQSQSFSFVGVPVKPVPSLLRGFSAPVQLDFEAPDEDLAFLMAHDSDPFNRWESGRQLAKRAIEECISADEGGDTLTLYAKAFGAILSDHSVAFAMRAEMMVLPSIESVAEHHAVVDVAAIHDGLCRVRHTLAAQYQDQLKDCYLSLSEDGDFSLDSDAIGRRRLKNSCMRWLGNLNADVWLPLATRQFETAATMTDSAATLMLIANHDLPDRDRFLSEFYQQWKQEKLVIDKWFAAQAISEADDTVDRVTELKRHADFTLSNPNRVRALVGAFALQNTLHFHSEDGAGYRLLSETVMELDSANPQIAAYLVAALSRWRRFDESRQTLMRHELTRISRVDGLSPDVFEIVAKSLEQ